MANNHNDIQHKAIDGTGTLGSLYDGRRYCLLFGERVISKTQSLQLSTSLCCEIARDVMDVNFNLLRFIQIQDELKLDLLLKIRNRVGIAAVMNYSHRIDKHTRFFYYSFITRKEQIIGTPEEIQRLNGSSDPQFKGTHIITAIDYGIDLVAVLQLPDDPTLIFQIDDALNRICRALLNDNYNIIYKEETLLNRIAKVTVYSNKPILTSIANLFDMFHRIDRIKAEYNHCHPVNYYLRPTTWLNPQYTITNATLKVIPKELSARIEQYLLRVRNRIKYIDTFLKQHMSKFLCGHIQDLIYETDLEWRTLRSKYQKGTKEIADLVVDIRRGRRDLGILSRKFYHCQQILGKKNIDQLIEDVHHIEEGTQQNKPSRQQSFNDYKESQWDLDRNSAMKNIQSTIKEDYKNSTLNNTENSSKSNEFNQHLFGRDTNNSNTDLVSSTVDNIYSPPRLQQMDKFSSESNDHQRNERIPSPLDIPEDTSLSRSSIDDTINILLLGETGVGKSTFINAFINYLCFDNLDQAQVNKPHVIIPVSFLMTVGENFDEKLIEFIDMDNSKNEDFSHCGQSVTQKCQSYLFNLNNGTKLCLIDTPGFADTRGIDRDEINLEHILEYIHHLKHLNAICFLLKPNSSRLNIFFRLCFNQLFDFLGKNICQNIIFCFTNSRSTFYSPGDTAPLIKTMLKSLSINDIQLKKENTFCFDSEAFRYLVAIQNQIQFNDQEKSEYNMSWSISVKESFRLIDQIRQNPPIQILNDQLKSIKDAQFQIIHLIRPVNETIRNLLRNLILFDHRQDLNESIELYSTVIHRPAFLCYSCSSKINPIGHFWIGEDSPHEFQEKCLTCSCHQDQHIQIEYLLNFTLVDTSLIHREEEMNEQLKILCQSLVTFNYFLLKIAKSKKEHDFFLHLTRMIDEERKICEQFQANQLNLQLINRLKEIKENSDKEMEQIRPNDVQQDLEFVYKWIRKVNEIPMIQQQLDAILKGKRILMKQNEIDPVEI